MCDDLTVTPTATAARPAEPQVIPADNADRRTSGRTLVLFGTLLAVALMLALPIRTWLAQKSELEAMRTEIASAQDRVAALQGQEQQWQDPRYLEGQARLRLNMVKPGESGLIALDHSEMAQKEIPAPPATTWYEKVWRSADIAAGRRPVQAPQPSSDAG